MFSQLCVLIVVAVAVDGCVKTDNKRHGESCLCSDACLDNSYCLNDGMGGFACECLPCQFFDPEFGQCMDLPGLGESCKAQCVPGLECGQGGTCVNMTTLPPPGANCTGVCAANLTCLNNTDGTSTCEDCPPPTEYDPVIMECVTVLPPPGANCTGECAANLTCLNNTDGTSTCEDCPPPTKYDPVTMECVDVTLIGPNEPCTDADYCTPNMTCQNNTGGNFTCQECPEFQEYDPMLWECIPPGLGEPCLDICAAPYICDKNTKGDLTCQECPFNQHYDPEEMGCVDDPGRNHPCEDMCKCNLECMEDSVSGNKTCDCPATSTGYNVTTETCSSDCIQNQTNACRCMPDGDYPACSPLCQDGRYITCFQNYLYVRDCARGNYRYPNGTFFLAPTVFDPVTRNCEWESESCPRALDDNFP